ncbi:MAG TPA: alpha/beta fold hydrolase [Burkholderiaceae bacterium]|nr:alpha/beta fold hydrolase [Burkholderiaceae bacterium]
MAVQQIDRTIVEIDGAADARDVVVMVHGLGGTTNTWTPLLPALAHMKTVRVEMPGSGRSARAHALERGPLTIDSLAQAVLRVVGALGLTHMHLAGHSLGTIVCQHIAAGEPARIASLLLFAPVLAPPDGARAGLRQRAAKVRTEGMYAIADSILQSALSASTREQSPVAVTAVRESLLAQDAEGYARTAEALADAQPAAVENIKCPVLLVTGDEDVIAPPQSVRVLAGKLLEAGAQTRVEVLPRCGHWTPLERPVECQRLAREFYARLR